MSMKQRIEGDLREALKRGDKLRLSVLRMLKARLLEAEVARRSEKGRDYELEDDEAVGVIAAFARQRRQSIDSFAAGAREDLAAKEQMELGIVEQYLPQPYTEQEIAEMVEDAIREIGSDSQRELGRIMKLVMARVKGRADGKQVNELVRSRLK